jgi:hypothetical protein
MMKNAQNQRDWADQQMRERRQREAEEREEEKNYAQQDEAILRMRGMLEDEANQKKADFARSLCAENKRIAQEKRMREEAWKNDQERTNQLETTLTIHPERLDPDGVVRRTM